MMKGPTTMRNWTLILRMALFQLGFGLISILVLGVLNRVMSAEIGLSATLIGFYPYKK